MTESWAEATAKEIVAACPHVAWKMAACADCIAPLLLAARAEGPDGKLARFLTVSLPDTHTWTVAAIKRAATHPETGKESPHG